MKSKLIVINCFGRGGSNLIWNVIGSSPDVLQTRTEFHREIFRNRSERLWWRYWARLDAAQPVLKFFLGQNIKNKLRGSAVDAALRTANCYRTPHEKYRGDELGNLAITVKVMQEDIVFNKLLNSVIADLRFVAVVRHPIALIEGWKRRGRSIEDGVSDYVRLCERILAQSERFHRYHIVRFEDFLDEPFRVASELWEFCGVAAQPEQTFRIKIKKTMNQAGEHSAVGGIENTKVWINSQNVGDYLRQDINSMQEKVLRSEDLAYIRQKSSDVVRKLGYSDRY